MEIGSNQKLDYSMLENKTILHLGFDNTDSTVGKCTTHLAFKIISYLLKQTDAKFIDYPLLIRLNPNIPWKTRGNGAVCIRLTTRYPENITDYIIHEIQTNSDIRNGANPGLVIHENLEIPSSVRFFSDAALYDVLTLNHAEKILKSEGIRCYKFGSGHGVIGALAAVGSLLGGDHTFEAICYRNYENIGSPRLLSSQNVKRMDMATYPRTFNNFDYRKNRILITPHGPDPVFCGIRGENPHVVSESLGLIDPLESLDGYVIFRTNQGTNMHLQKRLKLSEVKPYMAGYLRGTISESPKVIPGGHVFFKVVDTVGDNYPVAVYAPTGLGGISSKLMVEDTVDIGFGVRNKHDNLSSILNLEYICILSTKSTISFVNPICKVCQIRMKSEGKNKGYQCDRCKNKTFDKSVVTIKRDLFPGIYLPEVGSHRHLTKPMQRFGRENSCPYIFGLFRDLFKNWFGDAKFCNSILNKRSINVAGG